MEHVHPDDLPTVLREMARVTRPGGHVVHLVPFYEQFAEPVQVDAHLTQAGRAWWLELFASIDELEVTREPPDVPEVALVAGADDVELLPYYFELVRR
jgi:SAM-dependent methyltransferase